MTTLIERFHEAYEKQGDCWIWIAEKFKHKKAAFDYGLMRVGGMKIYAHRFSFELHRSEIPAGLLVLHSCDRPLCVNPEHLSVGTHADNMKDAAAKGRMNRGEANKASKLTEHKAREVVKFYATGCFSQAQLGEKFGVSRSTISDVVAGKKWKHLSISLPREQRKKCKAFAERNGANTHPERIPRGDKHYKTQLLEVDVIRLRKMFADGSTIEELADRFNLTRAYAYSVAKGFARRVGGTFRHPRQ